MYLCENFVFDFVSLLSFVFCLCHTALSVSCSLVVVTCWEMADLLALLYVMFSCVLWFPGSGVVLDCFDF